MSKENQVTDEVKLKALAKAISTRAKSSGFVVLLRDIEGRAVLVPGHDVEFLGVYDERVRQKDVLEDLEFAGVSK